MDKHRDMKAKGEKAMDTKTGGSRGYLSGANPNSLENYLVRKQRKWGDIGHQRAQGLIYNTGVVNQDGLGMAEVRRSVLKIVL